MSGFFAVVRCCSKAKKKLIYILTAAFFFLFCEHQENRFAREEMREHNSNVAD
jgi:hypothetical protein